MIQPPKFNNFTAEGPRTPPTSWGGIPYPLNSQVAHQDWPFPNKIPGYRPGIRFLLNLFIHLAPHRVVYANVWIICCNFCTGCPQNDWGGTIQVFNTSDMLCMWQMFGMFEKDEKRNCSTANNPGIFVNFANHLTFMEETAYPTFSYDWFDLKFETPICQRFPFNLTDPGRCPNYVPF